MDAADYIVWKDSLGDFDQNGTIGPEDYDLWRDNFINATGGSYNGFNGETDESVDVDAADYTVWRSVPLPGFFDTFADYQQWMLPTTSAVATPGDYSGEGVVDAADYTVWRDALLAEVSQAEFIMLSGDYNADGVVDAADYTVWRDTLGAPGNENTGVGFAAADFNEDGTVDAADYTVWRDNLGAVPTAGSDWWSTIDDADIVPEPGALALLVMGALGSLSPRKRKRRHS